MRIDSYVILYSPPIVLSCLHKSCIFAVVVADQVLHREIGRIWKCRSLWSVCNGEENGAVASESR
jgi:hypothetical protein